MASVKQVAAHLDLTDRRVYELIEKGTLERAKRSNYNLDKVRVAYIRHLRELAGQAGRPREASKERDRLTSIKADQEQIKLDEARREVIPAGEIEEALTVGVTNMKVRLEAIPARLAPVVAAIETPHECERLIREQVSEALAELAEVRVSTAPDARE